MASRQVERRQTGSILLQVQETRVVQAFKRAGIPEHAVLWVGCQPESGTIPRMRVQPHTTRASRLQMPHNVSTIFVSAAALKSGRNLRTGVEWNILVVCEDVDACTDPRDRVTCTIGTTMMIVVLMTTPLNSQTQAGYTAERTYAHRSRKHKNRKVEKNHRKGGAGSTPRCAL